jgi:hypothetical protein
MLTSTPAGPTVQGAEPSSSVDQDQAITTSNSNDSSSSSSSSSSSTTNASSSSEVLPPRPRMHRHFGLEAEPLLAVLRGVERAINEKLSNSSVYDISGLKSRLEEDQLTLILARSAAPQAIAFATSFANRSQSSSSSLSSSQELNHGNQNITSSSGSMIKVPLKSEKEEVDDARRTSTVVITEDLVSQAWNNAMNIAATLGRDLHMSTPSKLKKEYDEIVAMVPKTTDSVITTLASTSSSSSTAAAATSTAKSIAVTGETLINALINVVSSDGQVALVDQVSTKKEVEEEDEAPQPSVSNIANVDDDAIMMDSSTSTPVVEMMDTIMNSNDDSNIKQREDVKTRQEEEGGERETSLPTVAAAEDVTMRNEDLVADNLLTSPLPTFEPTIFTPSVIATLPTDRIPLAATALHSALASRGIVLPPQYTSTSSNSSTSSLSSLSSSLTTPSSSIYEHSTTSLLQRASQCAYHFTLYALAIAMTKTDLNDDNVLNLVPCPPLPSPLLSRPTDTLETSWNEDEISKFVLSIARHGKAFHLVAKSVGTRTTQQCVNYYYTLWRRHPSYGNYRRYRDHLGRDARLDQELMRRDRAWLHFWRIDEEAAGPIYPPAQVSYPVEATHSEIVNTITQNGVVDGEYVLPRILPHLNIIVTPEGEALDVPPKGSLDLLKSVMPSSSSITTVKPTTENTDMTSLHNDNDDEIKQGLNIASTSIVSPTSSLSSSSSSSLEKVTLTIGDLVDCMHEDPISDLKLLLNNARNAVSAAMNDMKTDRDKDQQSSSSLSSSSSSSSSTIAGPEPNAPSPSSMETELETVAMAIQRKVDARNHGLTGRDRLKDDRLIDNESFCGVCGDGGDLICCDGPCRRSFHIACLKLHDKGVRAVILASPALQKHRWFGQLFSYERDDWRCFACISGCFECYVCGEQGHENIDVFRCSRLCGKHYHLDCLQKHYPHQTEWLPAHQSGHVLEINQDHKEEDTVMKDDDDVQKHRTTIVNGLEQGISSSSSSASSSSSSSSAINYQVPPDEAIATSLVALRIIAGKVPDRSTTTTQQKNATDITLSSSSSSSASSALEASSAEEKSIEEVHDENPRRRFIPPGTSVRFVCPLHTCTGCSQPFHAFIPALYFRCHACPSTFHLPCVPMGASRDMNEILTCPDSAAHSRKKLSEIYLKKSGLSRTRKALTDKEREQALDDAAQRRRETLGSGSSGLGGSNTLLRALAAVGGGGGGGGGGGRRGGALGWIGSGQGWWTGHVGGARSALLSLHASAAAGGNHGYGTRSTQHQQALLHAQMTQGIDSVESSLLTSRSSRNRHIHSDEFYYEDDLNDLESEEMLGGGRNSGRGGGNRALTKGGATGSGKGKQSGASTFAAIPQLNPKPGVSRRSHLDWIDAVFQAEIKRRADLVVAAGFAQRGQQPLDGSRCIYTGVKLSAVILTSGKSVPSLPPGSDLSSAVGSRWISRISVAQGDVLVHLGTFDDAVDAAVAFDYATSYLRGYSAPKLNFPLSASECRVEGPIDPYPPSVQAEIDFPPSSVLSSSGAGSSGGTIGSTGSHLLKPYVPLPQDAGLTVLFKRRHTKMNSPASRRVDVDDISNPNVITSYYYTTGEGIVVVKTPAPRHHHSAPSSSHVSAASKRDRTEEEQILASKAARALLDEAFQAEVSDVDDESRPPSPYRPVKINVKSLLGLVEGRGGVGVGGRGEIKSLQHLTLDSISQVLPPSPRTTTFETYSSNSSNSNNNSSSNRNPKKRPRPVPLPPLKDSSLNQQQQQQLLYSSRSTLSAPEQPMEMSTTTTTSAGAPLPPLDPNALIQEAQAAAARAWALLSVSGKEAVTKRAQTAAGIDNTVLRYLYDASFANFLLSPNEAKAARDWLRSRTVPKSQALAAREALRQRTLSTTSSSSSSTSSTSSSDITYIGGNEALAAAAVSTIGGPWTIPHTRVDVMELDEAAAAAAAATGKVENDVEDTIVLCDCVQLEASLSLEASSSTSSSSSSGINDGSEGLWIELDSKTLAPKCPFNLSHDITIAHLGTAIVDESGEKLQIAPGFTSFFASQPSYRSPSHKGVYMLDFAAKMITPENRHYSAYRNIVIDAQQRNNIINSNNGDSLDASAATTSLSSSSSSSDVRIALPANYPYAVLAADPMKAKQPLTQGSTLVIREYSIREKGIINTNEDRDGGDVHPQAAQGGGSTHKGLLGPHLGPLFFTLLKAISHAEARERGIVPNPTSSPSWSSSPSSSSSSQLLSLRAVAPPRSSTSSTSANGGGGGGVKKVKSLSSSSSTRVSTTIEGVGGGGGVGGGDKSRTKKTNVTALVSAMRKKPEHCGIPPFVAVNPNLAHLTTFSQDTTVRCRHEACNFEFLTAKDIERAIAGKKDDSGRYISPVGHMWRHETQLFRHPLCNKETCAVCIYVVDNLMSMQKGGVNSDTLDQSSSPITSSMEATAEAVGQGLEGGGGNGSGGGIKANEYAHEDITAVEEPVQAVDEYIESAEASI